jgi:N-acetylmuramoyl-L-alanine amidase
VAHNRGRAGAAPRSVLWALALLSALVAGCGGSASHAGRTQARATISALSVVSTSASAVASSAVRTARAQASSTEAAAPLAGRVIVIDPGHNGGNAAAPEVINRPVPAGRGRMKACNTTGTETDGGYAEAAFNFDVAMRLRALLAAQGARVVMTRHNNTGVGPCVNERAAIGNQAHADATIAIHADGGPPEGRGFQVIYAPDEGETAPNFAASLRLARSVHAALLASGIFPPSTYDGHNGYSVRSDLAGLNLSRRPSILVELGNMRNATDAGLQTNPDVRQRLAEALASGIERFLGR